LEDKRGLIIGGYPLTNEERMYILNQQSDSAMCYIAVDGGLLQFMLMDIVPDLFIGDMDSVRESALFWYFKRRRNCFLLKKDKNFLDMEAAIDSIETTSLKKVEIWGVLGGRTDQTFSCIALLKRAREKGIELVLRTGDERMGLISGKVERQIQCEPDDLWSFIAISECVTGLSLSGFKYNLENQTLRDTETLTLSNVSVTDCVNIGIDSGEVLYFNKTGRHENVE